MSRPPEKAVLLIEDNAGDARLLREMLSEQTSERYDVTHVTTMAEAELRLAERKTDITLIDLGLPDADGLAAVRRAHAAAPRVALVVLTGHDDESLALDALKEGAQDYLVKGQIEFRGVQRALRYAIERKSLEERLLVEKQRALVTLNCIADAVICSNAACEITFMNVAAEKLTGWPWHEAKGRPLTDVFVLKPVAGGAPGAAEGSLLVGRTAEVPIEASIAVIRDDGSANGEVVVFRDVSAARAASRQITHSAEHDALTGLPNRLLLNDRARQAIALATRHLKQVSVLFLDLDGFKHINDSLGHPVGDKLLRSIALRLCECVRASDTVSRQGGDEFVVLLSEVAAPVDAAIIAQRMLKAVALPHVIDHHELHVTTSIGVSVFPDDGLDADTLIKHADTAMYQAKGNGRQSYQFFRPAMNLKAVERHALEEALRRGLEREELTLHYQPKIALSTGEITGAEALVRWSHPTRGAISPAQFIPIAEESGLIVALGRWVLRQACAQTRAWQKAGLNPGTIAVNVSAKELLKAEFLPGVLAVLAETQLDPASLEVELTESVLMGRVETTATMLQALRERGVSVALDDFGTGYSSLSYLRKFPIDTLKIDQSFISHVASDAADASIVNAVIAMAQSLELNVVAEGVETFEQLKFLRGSACDQAQGYCFSRPLPPEKFAALLATGIRHDPATAYTH